MGLHHESHSSSVIMNNRVAPFIMTVTYPTDDVYTHMPTTRREGETPDDIVTELKIWDEKIERVFNDMGQGKVDPSYKEEFDTCGKRLYRAVICYPVSALCGFGCAALCCGMSLLGALCTGGFDRGMPKVTLGLSIRCCVEGPLMHWVMKDDGYVSAADDIRRHILFTIQKADACINAANGETHTSLARRVALVKRRDALVDLMELLARHTAS